MVRAGNLYGEGWEGAPWKKALEEGAGTVRLGEVRGGHARTSEEGVGLERVRLVGVERVEHLRARAAKRELVSA
eukprot:5806745-Prymnesium_polylepis.1